MDQDREAAAQQLLNETIERIKVEFGVEVKQRLMIQNVSDNYAVLQSTLYLTPIASWQPPPPATYQPKAVNPVWEVGNGADLEMETNGHRPPDSMRRD